MEKKNLPNPLDEPELPKPDEKLLRAPTFWEKYGWLRSVIIVAIIVALIDIGIYAMLRSGDQTLPPPVTQSTQTANIPTQIPRANWKTYTSSTGKFTFQYPSGYTLQTTPQSSAVQITSNNLPNNFKLTITYQNATPSATLPQLIERNKLCPSISSQLGLSSSLNGKGQAKVYIDTPCGSDTKTVIYLINNNMLYTMTIQTTAKFNDIKPSLDAILATFHFN
jgi:hypothetical protein